MTELRRAIVTGIVLGLVCAVTVWWLERFEVSRLHGQFHSDLRSYLGNYDAFRVWMDEHGIEADAE